MTNPPAAAMTKLPGILAVFSIAFSCASFAAPQPVSIKQDLAEDEQLTAPRPPAERLDIRSLESRLRETRAIDPLGKLRLKGEIDALVGRFRDMHVSGTSAKVTALRQPYDQMIERVQSQLGRDPLLAYDIDASREAIWRVLADPAKFRSQISAVR